MKNIQLFENFGENKLTFTDKIKTQSANSEVSIYKAPDEIRSNSVKGGAFTWEVNMDVLSYGFELKDARILKLSLEIEVEKEDEEEDDYTYETIHLEGGASPTTRVNYEVEDTQMFYVSYIELDMHYSMDPEDWTYEITLGSKHY